MVHAEGKGFSSWKNNRRKIRGRNRVVDRWTRQFARHEQEDPLKLLSWEGLREQRGEMVGLCLLQSPLGSVSHCILFLQFVTGRFDLLFRQPVRLGQMPSPQRALEAMNSQQVMESGEGIELYCLGDLPQGTNYSEVEVRWVYRRLQKVGDGGSSGCVREAYLASLLPHLNFFACLLGEAHGRRGCSLL